MITIYINAFFILFIASTLLIPPKINSRRISFYRNNCKFINKKVTVLINLTFILNISLINTYTFRNVNLVVIQRLYTTTVIIGSSSNRKNK